MQNATARQINSFPAARFLPGLALTAAIAAVAVLLQRWSGIASLSPMVVAMLIGMALRNLSGPVPQTKPGITISLKKILRLAIMLLGLQLTLAQVAAIGLSGITVIVTTLLATFLFVKLTGRALGVDGKLSELIAAGTAVCGASAVLAANTVTRGKDEDVAYAIACVTVFGSLSMLSFPAIGALLSLGADHYGLWVGAAIHEVAQVVVAAFQLGDTAGQVGTVAKLGRVILLAPLIMSLGLIASRRADRQGGDAAVPMPWFVLGFVAMMLVNSAVEIPPALHQGIVTATVFMLTMALAAMGLETDVLSLRAKGLKPLLLGALGWVFVSVFGLGLVLLVV